MDADVIDTEDHRTRVGRERRGRTGLRILEAIFDAVDADGVGSLTIDRVRALAGLSRGTLYNYASTLDDLLARTAFLIWRQVKLEQEAMFPAAGAPIERLSAFLRYGVARVIEDAACGQILLRTLAWTGTFSDEMRAGVVADLEAAAAEGSIEVTTVETAVDMAMGMVIAMIRIGLAGPPSDERIAEQAGIVFRAIGVRSPAAFASRPLPAGSTVPIRQKVFAAGWTV